MILDEFECIDNISLKCFRQHKNKCGVYLLWNTRSNRGYVGYSNCIGGRWGCHLRYLIRGTHDNVFMQREWDIYGLQAFKFYICGCYVESELPKQEVEWISKLNTYTNGYNLTPGGEVWTSEMREFFSNKMRKMYEDPEYMKLHKERASLKLKKLWEDPEFRKMRIELSSEQCRDRIYTDEERCKRSKNAIEQWKDQKFKSNMKDMRRKLWQEEVNNWKDWLK